MNNHAKLVAAAGDADGSHVITVPSDIRKGDIGMWAYASYYTGTFTTPDGWTFTQWFPNANDRNVAVGWLIATGTESGTWTLSTPGNYTASSVAIYRPHSPVGRPTLFNEDGTTTGPKVFVPEGAVAIAASMACDANDPYSSWFARVHTQGTIGGQDTLIGLWPTVGGRTNGPVTVTKGGGGAESSVAALVFPPVLSAPDSIMR